MIAGCHAAWFTCSAQRILRHPVQFDWATVTLLSLAVYVYAVELERGRHDIVLAGLAFWLMDGFNEITNALVLHFNGSAALWTITGRTSFLLLIGLPIEVTLFFAINGVAFAKLLPVEWNARAVWGLSLALSCVSVAVELLLHADGTFHWHYWWWNAASFPVIVVLGYLTFYVVGFRVFYAAPRRRTQIVAALAALDGIAVLVFGVGLRWI